LEKEFLLSFKSGNPNWELFGIPNIDKLPDDVSLEDIMYEINFIGRGIEGLKDSEQGNTITAVELLKKVQKWAK